MSTKYLLIHRGPDGTVGFRKGPVDGAFPGKPSAADAVAMILIGKRAETDAKMARRFASALGRMEVGAILGHGGSNYDFRILPAYFTADKKPVPITPGLKIITNDLKWGIVEPTQFMNETDPFLPGGQFFDGWYNVNHLDGSRYAKFNGERLGTKKPE
jgi:hypothetical protein